MRVITKLIFFNILKWKIVGNTNLLKKCIIIAAPHTHWLDFFIAIMARKIMKQEINFIGKKELAILILIFIGVETIFSFGDH